MSNTSSSNANPWFGLSMALMGVIVGYGLALGTGSSMPAQVGAPNQVADAPTPTPTPTPAPTPTAKDVVPVDPDEDWIYGDPDATISVIEYSDYECPFCKRHHPTLKSLVDNNDDVNWVYRHFPLAFHTNAQKAAEGAECAGELGGNDAFWDFSDKIFDVGIAQENYTGYAEDLGLNVAKFNDCLTSGKYADKVKEQMAGGSAGGVSGTPGNIVINNETDETRLVSGAQPESAFQAAVDALR